MSRSEWAVPCGGSLLPLLWPALPLQETLWSSLLLWPHYQLLLLQRQDLAGLFPVRHGLLVRPGGFRGLSTPVGDGAEMPQPVHGEHTATPLPQHRPAPAGIPTATTGHGGLDTPKPPGT